MNLTGISCVPNDDLIVVSTLKGVYIHEYSTRREPIRVFNEHEGYVNGLAHLFKDIFASVDMNGMLLTWRATNGIVLNRLNISSFSCKAITKAGGSKILVGSGNGKLQK